MGVDPRLLRTNNTSEAPIKMSRQVDRPHVTMSMHTYTQPRPLRQDTNVAMCTENTIAYILSKEPASTLPRHGPDRDLRELTTTTHTVYGGPFETNYGRCKPRTAPERRLSGLQRTSSELQQTGAAVTARRGWPERAVGEKLMASVEIDPKQHTFMQRSWRYSREQDAVYGHNTDWSRVGKDNMPGLALRGLGEDQSMQIRRRNPARLNDALSDKTGVWSG